MALRLWNTLENRLVEVEPVEVLMVNRYLLL